MKVDLASTVKKIDPRVTQLISNIQEDHPTAAVAGGYLRDLIFNRTPRDLDIFVHKKEVTNFCFLVEELFPKVLEETYSTQYYYHGNENQYFLSNFNSYKFVPLTKPSVDSPLVDLVITPNKVDTFVSQSFDYNFNSVMYRGKSILMPGKVFHEFLKTGQVHNLAHINSIPRLDRFTKEFPEFDWSQMKKWLDEVNTKKTKTKATITSSFYKSLYDVHLAQNAPEPELQIVGDDIQNYWGTADQQ